MATDIEQEIAEAWADLRELGKGVDRTLSLSPARRLVRSPLTSGPRAVVVGTYNSQVRYRDFRADVMYALEEQRRIELQGDAPRRRRRPPGRLCMDS